MASYNSFQQQFMNRSIKDTPSKELSQLSMALWRKGFRYWKNDKNVFGRPQLTFRKERIAVFIDAEFYHGKDWNTDKYLYKPTVEWHAIIEKNIDKDIKVNNYLTTHGWTVLRFWSREVQNDFEGCLGKVEEMILRKRR